MTRRKMITGLIMCCSIVLSAELLLCQEADSRRTRPSRENFRSFQGNMFPGANLEDFIANMKEREAQMMKQALGVDDEQWKVIEPKLENVRLYRDQAIGNTETTSFGGSFRGTAPGQMGGGTFGGFSGGSYSFRSSTSSPTMDSSSAGNMLSREPTEVERISTELQTLLQNPDTQPSEIRQKLDSLRKARLNAKKQWAQAQQELRKVLNLRQEATLLMMGLLE